VILLRDQRADGEGGADEVANHGLVNDYIVRGCS
jgi:hypothetical protein